jgi:hypothetical protein
VHQPHRAGHPLEQLAVRLHAAVRHRVAQQVLGHPVQPRHEQRRHEGGECHPPAGAPCEHDSREHQHVDAQHDEAADMHDEGVPHDRPGTDGRGHAPGRGPSGEPAMQEQQPTETDRREQHIGKRELRVVHDGRQRGRDDRQAERHERATYAEHAPAEEVRKREGERVHDSAHGLGGGVHLERIMSEEIDRRQQQGVTHAPEGLGVVAGAARSAGQRPGREQVPVLVGVRDRGWYRARQPQPPGDQEDVPDHQRDHEPPTPPVAGRCLRRVQVRSRRAVIRFGPHLREGRRIRTHASVLPPAASPDHQRVFRRRPYRTRSAATDPAGA